jgi:phosphoribosylformylglycinamidine cyclo-ligase
MREMYQVFNMGHRFEIYTDEKTAEEMIGISSEYNVDAKVIGHVEPSDNRKLTIRANDSVYEYIE